MAVLSFETIRFQEEEGCILVSFYLLFGMKIPKDEFGKVSCEDGKLIWDNIRENEATERFAQLFNKYLPSLMNKVTKKPTTYIHRSSGIPLIGSLAFGIVDRGTNMLEVKPLTGCNINCTFCSVDEGDNSRKIRDYLVEREYLTKELRSILQYKQEPMDIWLNTQGEPTMYAEMTGLIGDMKQLPFANKIALITNGTLLSKPYLAALRKSGLAQLDISLNAINAEKGKVLAGTNRYPGEKVQEMVIEAVKIGLDVVIAPVYMKGVNEKDIEDITAFAEKTGCKKVYIQNFLPYRLGRNPVNGVTWRAFEKYLKGLQEKHPYIDLFARQHTIKTSKPLPKPFSKGENVTAMIVASGRYPGEMLGAACGRCITIVHGKAQAGEKVLVGITRDKDNIFYGEEKKRNK